MVTIQHILCFFPFKSSSYFVSDNRSRFFTGVRKNNSVLTTPVYIQNRAPMLHAD